MTHAENRSAAPGLDATTASACVAVSALTPEEKLAASRAALRAWLSQHQPRGEPPANGAAPSDPSEEPIWLSALFDAFSDVPTAAVAARWLRRWWQNHPLRAVIDLAAALARELTGPVAARHPGWLVLGALISGVALTRVRPWRWISGGALLASLLPRLDLNSILRWVTETMSATLAQQQAASDHSDAEPMTDRSMPPQAAPPNPAENPSASSVH
ncbi:MAG TPA: hypothetical protein VE029_05505 [Rhizobacter sp.]|nr:hypothetical protein [Rhizobacter sp.]